MAAVPSATEAGKGCCATVPRHDSDVADRSKPCPHRRNGFQPPFDPYQLLSWAFFVALPVLFGVFTAPFMHTSGARVAVSVVYGLLVAVCLVLNYVAASCDPADPGIFEVLTATDLYFLEPPAEKGPCERCKAFVLKPSKHCRKCQKCVAGFDHHCNWLNNCVGAANYPSFFLFVIATIVSMLFHTALALYHFIDSFVVPDWYRARMDLLYSGKIEAYRACTAISTVIAGGGVLPVIYLLGFHIMIYFRKQTTYEWILEQRAKREARSNPAQASEQPIITATSPKPPDNAGAGADVSSDTAAVVVPTAAAIDNNSNNSTHSLMTMRMMGPGSQAPSLPMPMLSSGGGFLEPPGVTPANTPAEADDNHLWAPDPSVLSSTQNVRKI
eukprot:TRINITY_DN8088_c0_g1_i1.p1 TRINITY_DN8088_c0_g1~~TRINITY_DN8088_c0_g1_i1.p1  ORF type:complete len:385 (-),score=68.73 TRINITY_DN8088_c0_g1_i1:216-1370(-)